MADLGTGDCGPLWCTYPYGNDTVDVRDGEVDSVTCGFGQDTVRADPMDVIARDCEVVDVPTRAPAGPGVSGPTGPGAVTPPPPAPRVRIALVGCPKLAAGLRPGVRVRVTVVSGRRVTVKALSGRLGLAVGSAPVRARAAVVRLRFTPAGRARPARKASVRLTFVVAGARATALLRR
jgi:hypothetical protein